MILYLIILFNTNNINTKVFQNYATFGCGLGELEVNPFK